MRWYKPRPSCASEEPTATSTPREAVRRPRPAPLPATADLRSQPEARKPRRQTGFGLLRDPSHKVETAGENRREIIVTTAIPRQRTTRLRLKLGGLHADASLIPSGSSPNICSY